MVKCSARSCFHSVFCIPYILFCIGSDIVIIFIFLDLCRLHGERDLFPGLGYQE